MTNTRGLLGVLAVAAVLSVAACKNKTDQQNGPLDAAPDVAPADAQGAKDAASDASTRPACDPRMIPFNFEEPHAGPGADAGAPFCSVERSGEAVVTYDIPCTPTSQYAGCVFALNQDFDTFDPDRGRAGMYALRFCAETAISGAFDLWYEIEGGPRRFLPVLDQTAHMDPGCLTRYWTSDDSCYGLNRCGPTGCGRDAGSPAPTDAQRSDAGRGSGDAGTDGAPGVCPSYARSKVSAYSEWCTAPNAGSVRLLWLKYYQPACACDTDNDCPAPMRCDRGGWFPGSACYDGGCRGICTD